MRSPFNSTGCHTGFLWVNPADRTGRRAGLNNRTSSVLAKGRRQPANTVLVFPCAARGVAPGQRVQRSILQGVAVPLYLHGSRTAARRDLCLPERSLSCKLSCLRCRLTVSISPWTEQRTRAWLPSANTPWWSTLSAGFSRRHAPGSALAEPMEMPGMSSDRNQAAATH
jgi:hypothetical protein